MNFMKINSYNKTEKKWPVFLTAVLIVLLFLFCMNDYNPFEDPLNAKAIFLSGPSDGDTVRIFTSDTFAIALLVSPYLDSFSIQADSNRFGDMTFTRLTGPGLNQEKYSYRVSFWDTGWHEIRLISFRSGDVQNSVSKVIEDRRIYAVSPLSPGFVSGSMGDSILLQTDSVGDRDVLYHWDFGGTLIETEYPVSKQIIHLSGTGTTGKMWVSDFYKKYSSQKVDFNYFISDQEGPEIFWTDQNGMPGDTIKVSKPSFFFRVSIVDRGSNTINSATVNDSMFDQKQYPFFMKRIDNLDTLKGSLKLNVKATDKFLNGSQKTFYAIYDTTSSQSFPPRILIEHPSKDNIVTALRNWSISGTLEYTYLDSITMQMSVNGSPYNTRCFIYGLNNRKWEFPVTLQDTVNEIMLAAYDNRGNMKADTSITMIYDNDLLDTVHPVIVSMTIDNNPVSNGNYAEKDPDSIRIVAFDEGTGISAVVVNGDTVNETTESYVWIAKVKSSDMSPGIFNKVRITDKSGNFIDTSFYLIHNSTPVIMHLPTPPLPLLVGQTYIDTILAVDADQDRIFYTKKEGGPKGCSVDSLTGLIKWTPAAEDTGINNLTIFVRDKFRAVPYLFQIFVEDSASLNDPVRFITQEKEFPALVEADKDTIVDTLKIASGTGKPPFTFSVRLLPKDTLIKVVNRVFKWAPSMSDTGYNKMVVTVTDSFKRSDAIYPLIRVVSPNRVFKLESNSSTLKDSSGVINLNHSEPKTLIIQIIDPYGCDVNNYDVIIKSAGKTYKGAVDSGLVKITLDPAALKQGLDTLTVKVTDVVGKRDSISERVFYGSIPDKPQLILPVNDSIIKNTSAALSWKCSDSDHDSLSYSVYIAGKDTVYTRKVELIPDTFYSLSGLTRAESYFWKVVADDRKTQVVSDIGNFYIDPPLRVRFKTSISAFPYFLEALKDSLYLALEVTGSSGYSPFRFSADVSGKSISIVNGSYIKWKPLVSDTGSQVLTAKVSDSAGNFDTLRTVIRVVPQNRPCSLFVSGADTIDMRNLPSPQILHCTVKDPDPVFAEHHTVKIIQRNTERVEEVDSTRQFSISIDADSSSRSYDSLTVILSDKAGHSFTVKKVIFYGMPPVSPFNPAPVVGRVLTDSIVSFSWTGGDPDNDDVTYNLYIGTNPDSLVKAGSVTNQTSFTDTVNKWGSTYYWKVVATDKQGKTEGPVWSFRLSENLSRIFLNTSGTGANITSMVTGIPIAVRLDSTKIDFSQFDAINHDIRFKKPNGVELPVEIQNWDQINKTALIWVLIDTVFGNNSLQFITMYKGNGQNTSGGQVVFSDFSGVWHMSGNGSTESDISGNNNNGNRVNLNQNNIVDGIAGKAVKFDLYGYLDMGNNSSLQINNRITIETWIKVSSSSSGIEPVVTKGNQSYSLNIDNAQNKFQMSIYNTAGQTRTVVSDSTYNIDSWCHVAGVFDGFNLNLYVNGVRQTPVNAFGYQMISSSADPFRIGGNASNPTSGLRGTLDEVRVSASSRSADWVKLSYESQRLDSRLLSFVKTHL
jgi:hypothetical protein